MGEEAHQTFKWTILDDDRSTIREIPRQDREAKTENVINNQHKDIPNERPKCGSKGKPKPLQPDEHGS